MMRFVAFALLVSPLVLVAGCGEDSKSKTSRESVDSSKYLLASEPAGARGVIEARKDVKDKDEVVIIGRIGGESNPWVDDKAAFSIVDTSCVPCNEIEGDTCPKPWDYCCEPDLASKRALVLVVDETGKEVRTHARELLNVTELQTVVVRGTAQRDDAGNLTILANGVFVRPQKK